ncbi:hypothetical protein Rsub_12567 [Raphidocelis subcapitata]|uniref:Uncharacterized protein n=1 Tax=Raphidocelis subcapitata TaxID=307507 RepID=A0A2V0PJ32_9CHLO|nr:hypothetical protein Rsub_12567 [Raphidocelis subcapitata]|eukprot:GBF99814.1 hypothetical protein Rsub_12567 [Raphidocelis subcapitata]
MQRHARRLLPALLEARPGASAGQQPALAQQRQGGRHTEAVAGVQVRPAAPGAAWNAVVSPLRPSLRAPACGALWRGFASSAGGGSSGSSGSSGSGEGSEGVSGADGGASLQSSMDKLVDAAVGLVEAGKLGQAVEVLQQGIQALGAAFPGSPELGELHNQVALLLFLGGQPDQAASHAQSALEVTQAVFGTAHPLTAHRLLRLATVRVGQSRGNEAAPLLAVVVDILNPYPEDTGLQEAKFYLGLLQAGAAASASELAAADDALLAPLRALSSALGPDSMITRLAVGQHARLAGLALDESLALGEAAFRQHIRLQEAISPDSPDLALSLYQLAVVYYAADMLGDAGVALQRAAALLRQHFPPEHDLVQMCMHRLGMICAAGHDPRAAQQLLTASRARYAAAAREQGGAGRGEGDHPLAHEAEAGLAMAASKTLDPALPAEARAARRAELAAAASSAADSMARSLGQEHLLVAGARRYAAQMAAAAK